MERRLYFIILILNPIHSFHCALNLNKMVCTTYDKEFSRFDLCELRLLQKEIPSISVKIHLLQPPLTNCDVHIQSMFTTLKDTLTLFNATWNGCDFLQNNRRYKSLMLFYGMIVNSTNVNHTCPYYHDIHVIDFRPTYIPLSVTLPKGNMYLKTQYFVNKKLQVAIDFNATNT